MVPLASLSRRVVSTLPVLRESRLIRRFVEAEDKARMALTPIQDGTGLSGNFCVSRSAKCGHIILSLARMPHKFAEDKR